MQCTLFSPLNPLVVCDFLADLCEAHVLYQLARHPDVEVKDIFHRWQRVWYSLAVVLQAFSGTGDIDYDTSKASECLDRLHQLHFTIQESIRAHALELPTVMSSDFLVPFLLTLTLQRAAGVSSPTNDRSVDFWIGAAIGNAGNPTEDGITTPNETPDGYIIDNIQAATPVALNIQRDNGEPAKHVDTSEPVSNTLQGVTLRSAPAEQQFDPNFLSIPRPTPMPRLSPSSSLSGSYVTARNEDPPFIPDSVL